MATRPIKIAIVGDDSNLRKSLKGASRKLEGFGKNVAKFGATAGLAFAATAGAVATKGITAFADFEKGMKEVMTLLPDAGAEAFGDLSSQVKDFAKEFGVLPDKAIPALYSALSAGVPKDNVFEFMEIAQKAAKGGVTELETAVDALSSVVNAYGVGNISAAESSDLLLTAVRLGKTTFGELANEIYKVAPIASAVGIPFENLTAAIANLTAQGTPTAQAATQMKAALAEMAKEGTKADTAFRDLSGVGLSTFLEQGGSFDEAIVMMKDGADAAGTSILDMFGSVEAGQAILALTADGGTAFRATLDEMGNSAGATQAAFETMDSGLSASFDKIKANLSVMAIETGERLAPHIAKATELILDGFEQMAPHIEHAREVVKQFVTEFIERATPAFDRFVEIANKVIDWVRTFIKENPQAALAALAVVVASIVVPAVLGLVAAFAALFSPVILIVAALAALAAGAVYAYQHFETFRNIVDGVRAWLVDVLWPAIQVVADGIVAAFLSIVDWLQENFVPITLAVVETLTAAWQVFADFFTEYVAPIVEAAFVAIASVLDNFWDVVKAMVNLVKALFSGDFKEVWFALRTMIGEVIDFIVDLFLFLPIRIFDASRPLIGKFALIVSDFAVFLLGKIVKLIQAIPDQIIEFLSGIATDILNVGKSIGGWIIDGIIAAVQAAAGAIAAAVRSVIPDVGGMVKGAVGKVGGFLGIGATGGIVTQPTLAIIGEAGPEAVVPLNRTPGSSPLPGGAPTFIINVNTGMGTDGHQVGNQIVSALKQWERSNGSLPLTVSAA